MKSLTAVAGLLVCLLAQMSCAKAQTPSRSIAGIWPGTLNASGTKLRIVLHFAGKADSTLAGTLDSPDQGATGIALTAVKVIGSRVRVEVASVGGRFEGDLSTDGKVMSGTWTQGPASLPLTLKRVASAPVVSRPQEPVKPYPYDEELVTFQDKPAGVKLAGTLTLPRGAGPFPAVALISGSGPNLRDEPVFGHKPFLVLADYLTRRGIAVLRYDKRGLGGSTGDYAAATSKDFADDAVAAVDYLKTRKEIAPHEIGLIGHSEGGLVAPMAAVRSPDVAFIVLMAGPGMRGDEILYRQGRLLTEAAGGNAQTVQRESDAQHRMFDIVEHEADTKVAETKLRAALTDITAHMSPAGKRAGAGTSEAVDAQVKAVMSPWFRFFLTYDPIPTLQKVRCPVLAIDGEKDLQVPAKEDLAAIEAALKAGGNTDYTVRDLPNLNHLFQTCKTGAVSEYPRIEETIAPVALQTIGDWVAAHTRTR